MVLISFRQVEYSPLVLDIESSPPNPAGDLLKTARELGVKIVAYSPLARGLITGQVVGSSPLIIFAFRHDSRRADFPGPI